ncbi:modification methylase HemK [Ascobolus immersus RN42]|uniref:peptide chain release factor N(5)-glutamine methyltransferase n=1 Tax=Ascobolus immersus RN42 TaxID=1160509 RepID=A0A3N4IL99_ASCIM|nr:modification methylase HemK [Ascobolus immersus RN42]
MPRIPSILIHQAASVSPFLPSILRGTRDLSSARTELRWITEEFQQNRTAFLANLARLPYFPAVLQRPSRIRYRPQWKWTKRLEYLRLQPDPARIVLRQCARLRERHYPLQYILGTQPFHLLDVVVRPGVLIPRPETEELTSHLAGLLETHHPEKLNVIDLCAGTGCIGLLLSCLVKGTTTIGVDISKSALACMAENKTKHEDLLSIAGSEYRPVYHDVLSTVPKTVAFINSQLGPGKADLIVSNPPYISSAGFNKDTSRSVRLWEPRLALVPDGVDENVFYDRIIDVATEVHANGIVFEVGSWDQATSIQRLMGKKGWKSSVWPDFHGKGRTVVAFREGGWEWLQSAPS